MRSNHVTAAALLALATGASAQNHVSLFSAGWHGPTMGVPDSGFGQPITEGDLLGATPKPGPGPLPAPTLFYAGGPGVVPNHLNLGWYPSAVGHGPGAMGFVEVDAFSLGLDPELTDDQVLQPGQLFFSVDEFALGVSTGGGPELATETPVGESSADAFANLSTIFLPSPVAQGSHVGVLDGDGVAGPSAFAYPGLGLVEPNSPQGAPPDGGDDLDALELQHEDWNALFFSLDSLYTDPHPSMGGTTNSGSAFAHGFLGGDVLMTLPGGNGPQLFAPANQLGLGLVGGDPDHDDLDALMVRENGNLVFDPPAYLHQWVGGEVDMVLFSVRRGSAVIGSPDSRLGMPIEEGDVLAPPIQPAHGGVSPYPAIYIPAEALGLATVRSGTASSSSPAMGWADDLNALDVLSGGPMFDCNGNSVEDAVDVAQGTSNDANGDGVPDECQGVGTPFCFCSAGAPCGNTDASAGCANSTGAGALLSGSGGTSVGADDLVLTVDDLPPNALSLLFMGPSQVSHKPFGDGLRCVGGTLYRYPVQGAPGGSTTYTGLVSHANANFPPAGHITAGSTWHFAHWYRDPGGPCGSTYSASSALSVTFTP